MPHGQPPRSLVSTADMVGSIALFGIGHNGGPPLDDAPIAKRIEGWSHYCWTRAHRRAWRTPPREIALRRLERAEELGMTYREYTAIVLDTGRNP